MQHQVERCDDKLQLQALVVLKAVQFASDVGLVSPKKKRKKKKRKYWWFKKRNECPDMTYCDWCMNASKLRLG